MFLLLRFPSFLPHRFLGWFFVGFLRFSCFGPSWDRVGAPAAKVGSQVGSMRGQSGSHEGPSWAQEGPAKVHKANKSDTRAS